jgi:hypothetical protein
MDQTDRLAAATIVAALIHNGDVQVDGDGGYTDIAKAHNDIAMALSNAAQQRGFAAGQRR